MKLCKEKLTVIVLAVLMTVILPLQSKDIIELDWQAVSGRCLSSNLSLRMKLIDGEIQKAEVMKAYGSFLPVLDYQFAWSDDESDDLMLSYQYPAGEIPANMFLHSLQFTFPLFTGGSRYANLKMQKHQSKSLSAELKGLETETVYQSLQSYYGLILSEAMVLVYEEALLLAESNKNQVEKLHRAGMATELDRKQAEVRYLETLPQLQAARNQRKLAAKQLKYMLNLNESDSLLIRENLKVKDFLGDYRGKSLEELALVADEFRSELLQVKEQQAIVKQQRNLALSQFMPQVALTASSTHSALSKDWLTSAGDFERYNSIGLGFQFPIFNGGSRYYDLRQADYGRKKMKLVKELTADQVQLDVEQCFYNYEDARDNLRNLQAAFAAAEENMRLLQSYYEQGLANQTEVLAGQLSYIQNQVALKQGIYNYNTSQLALLKAVGSLQSIWQ